MKRIFSVVLTLTLIAGFSSLHTNNAEAKTKVKTYANCKALNADYKGGVAKSSSTKNKGGKTKYKPYVSKDLYNANKKSDRDKDGIACER
ncbi:MAG: excalibur calcium-binding domain-containing protein [Bacillus sp. (in: firmicutes)]